MAKTKTSTAVKQRYNEKAYERLFITIPSGLKSAVEAHAETRGQSINRLVNALLRADMGYSDAQWKAQPQEMQEAGAEE